MVDENGLNEEVRQIFSQQTVPKDLSDDELILMIDEFRRNHNAGLYQDSPKCFDYMISIYIDDCFEEYQRRPSILKFDPYRPGSLNEYYHPEEEHLHIERDIFLLTRENPAIRAGAVRDCEEVHALPEVRVIRIRTRLDAVRDYEKAHAMLEEDEPNYELALALLNDALITEERFRELRQMALIHEDRLRIFIALDRGEEALKASDDAWDAAKRVMTGERLRRIREICVKADNIFKDKM